MRVFTGANHYIEPKFQEELLQILLEPITVGTLRLKNRILFAPVQTLPPENVWPDMHPTHIAFHETIARGGASMIVVGETDVTPNSEGALQAAAAGQRRPTKGIWSDDAIPGWAKLIDACHKWDAKVIPQLSSYASWRPRIAGVRGEGSMELIVPTWKEIGMTPEVLDEEKRNFVAAAVIDGLMRVQLDTEVPVFSVVLTPHAFHEHDAHHGFFRKHMKVKGAEAANACADTLLSLQRLKRLAN